MMYLRCSVLPVSFSRRQHVPLTAICVAVQSIQEGLQTNAVFSSSQTAAFWAYHIARSGFFMVQGLTGAEHRFSWRRRYEWLHWEACSGQCYINGVIVFLEKEIEWPSIGRADSVASMALYLPWRRR